MQQALGYRLRSRRGSITSHPPFQHGGHSTDRLLILQGPTRSSSELYTEIVCYLWLLQRCQRKVRAHQQLQITFGCTHHFFSIKTPGRRRQPPHLSANNDQIRGSSYWIKEITGKFILLSQWFGLVSRYHISQLHSFYTRSLNRCIVTSSLYNAHPF